MEGARDHLLAHPGLTQYEDGHIGGTDEADHATHRRHRLGGPRRPAKPPGVPRHCAQRVLLRRNPGFDRGFRSRVR
jgi:hypothetical protein